MNFKFYKFFVPIILLSALLNGCTADGKFKSGTFKHDTPLIKEDIRKTGKETVDETVELGPQPIEGDIINVKRTPIGVFTAGLNEISPSILNSVVLVELFGKN